jgi:integrase
MARRLKGWIRKKQTKEGVRYYPYLRGKIEGRGGFASEAEAQEILDAALDVDRGTAPKTFGLLFGEYMEHEEQLAAQRGRADVFEKEISLANVHIRSADFWSTPIKSIPPKRLQQHIGATLKKYVHKAVRAGATYRLVPTTRRVTRRTVERMLSRLELFYDWAILQGAVPAPNPARACVLPPRAVSEDEGDLIIHLYADEITSLFALPELTPKQRALFALGIYGGLRIGELFGLRWQDIVRVREQPMLRIRKSYLGACKTPKSRRDVPLLPQAVAALDAYRASLLNARITGLMFPAESDDTTIGERCHQAGYTAGWVNKRERRGKGGALREVVGVAQRAGVRAEVRFKHMRHTCACHLLQGTFGVKLELSEVSKWLGHSSMAVTERHYAAFAKDSLVDAVGRQLNHAPKTHEVLTLHRK